MATTLQVTLPTTLGRVEIYADPTKLAKAEKLIKDTPKILTDAYTIAATKYAERIAKMARSCLKRGMPPSGSGVSWPPHAESTVKRLGQHGLLYWSSQYYHNISVVKRGKHIAAGIASGRSRKTRPDQLPTRLTLSAVARILEFGGGYVPERPLWQYLWPAVGGREHYRMELVQQIRKQIRKYS